jgi:hypothetical protein
LDLRAEAQDQSGGGQLASIPIPTATSLPVAIATPVAPIEQFTLLKPGLFYEPTYGLIEFEWQWNGQIDPDQGFEVRVWREGEAPAGIHDAIQDNLNGNVIALGDNTYRLTADIRDAPGVLGRSGEYLWTVLLIQITPEYKELGIQATPSRLRFEAGGGSSGGNNDGAGGGIGGQ